MITTFATARNIRLIVETITRAAEAVYGRYGQGHTNWNIGMARPDQYKHLKEIFQQNRKQVTCIERERIAYHVRPFVGFIGPDPQTVDCSETKLLSHHSPFVRKSSYSTLR